MTAMTSSRTAMRAEIDEIPAVAAKIVDAASTPWAAIAREVGRRPLHGVMVVGRGTSDHAAIYARYLLEARLGLPVALAAPSLTTLYGLAPLVRGWLVVGVSQSGASPDVVAVVQEAQAAGALTVAVVNDVTSPLAAAADFVLPCLAGEERSVAATKSYVAELVVLARLATALRPDARSERAIARVPAQLDAVLGPSARWVASGVADSVAAAGRCLVVARGFNLATALETALKLKETGGVFADGYSTADAEHGPIILATGGLPVVAIRPDGAAGAGMSPALECARSAGAHVHLIGGREPGDGGFELPIDLPETLTPIPFAVPGLLLAEAVARRRGLDPDRPRGLSKITLTR